MHNAVWIPPSSRGPAHTAPSSLLLLPITAKENQYVNTHCKCWVLTLQGNVCLSLQFCSVRNRIKKNCSFPLPQTWSDEKHKRLGDSLLFLTSTVTGTFSLLIFFPVTTTENKPSLLHCWSEAQKAQVELVI